jgi:hypothetical protein
MGKVNDLEAAKKQLAVVKKLLKDIGSPLQNSPIIEQGKSDLTSRISDFLKGELVKQDIPEKNQKVILDNLTKFLKQLMKGVF